MPIAAQAEERQGGLRQYPWYRPDLGRMEVGKALKGQAVGSFYLRESSSQPGCFALAVQTGNNKVGGGGGGCTMSKADRMVTMLSLSTPLLMTLNIAPVIGLAWSCHTDSQQDGRKQVPPVHQQEVRLVAGAD